MLNVAVIGFGYWGPNIVRNFQNHKDCAVNYICDYSNDARSRATKSFPGIETIDDAEIIFSDENIDIVAVVTPVSTHYSLAKKALNSGKHVFIEKPMVETVEQANDLIKIAKEKNLVGVVDHTFLLTDAVKIIKSIIDSGEIGELTYFDSVRVNLGLFQHDINVIWDLAPHDLSILYYLTNMKPRSIMATGVDHLGNSLIDIGYITLQYNEKMIANFHVNWLSPVKVRRIIIGGTNKMILFDDMEPSEKIKIYDKGITVNSDEDLHKILVEYRVGDMFAPNIQQTEALKDEIETFIEQIKNSSFISINDMNKGKEVVQLLEYSDVSLKNNKIVNL